MSEAPTGIHHEVVGEGQGVVFTTGWLNTVDVWAEAVAALDGSVRTVRWDLPGHGRSEPAPGRYGRADVLEVLDEMIGLAGPPAILVGHSLGGYLSLAHAIGSPDRVAGLVLVAAGPGFRSRDSLQAWNDSIDTMAADRAGEIPPGSEEITKHVDSLVIDRLGEIDVPVIAIIGERDKRFLASVDVFEKYLDVRERIVVPDAGHMVHAKHPAVVAEAVATMAGLVGS